jgi:hypothetical protein
MPTCSYRTGRNCDLHCNRSDKSTASTTVMFLQELPSQQEWLEVFEPDMQLRLKPLFMLRLERRYASEKTIVLCEMGGLVLRHYPVLVYYALAWLSGST